MKDIIGTALLDYFHGNYTEDIITETNISEEDEMPLPYLFRSFQEMPKVEQKALEICKGKTLDVGCGAGVHSVYLQNNGIDVMSIDISKGAVEVCKLQGLKNVVNLDLLELKNIKFDTILLLMNGTGIFQKMENISKYLQHLKTILEDSGQILIDSSDLKYMFDEDDEAMNTGNYYGELEYSMRYKGVQSDIFNWLYLDEKTFEQACFSNGLNFEVLAHGENYDYLARLTKANDTL